MMGTSTCRYALIGLIVLQPLWYGWLAPPELASPWLAIVLMTAPLLVALPFVWRRTKTALVTTGCVLLIHFCVAVAEIWANPAARIPGIAQVLLIAIYFMAMSALRFGRQPDD